MLLPMLITYKAELKSKTIVQYNVGIILEKKNYYTSF